MVGVHGCFWVYVGVLSLPLGRVFDVTVCFSCFRFLVASLPGRKCLCMVSRT